MLSEYTTRALLSLQKEGVPFTLASGRAYSSMRRALNQSNVALPIISSDGGMISPWESPSPLWLCPMDSALPKTLVELGLKLGLKVLVDLWDGVQNAFLPLGLGHHKGWDLYLEWKGVETHFRLGHKAPLKEEWHRTQVISLTFMDTPQKILQLETLLRKEWGDYVKIDTQNWSSHKDWAFLWIQNPKATKEAALSQWIQLHQGQYDRVVVFGDEFNDVGMFKMGYYGVAVENAIPQIKELAQEVIGPSWEDSVIRYILKQENLAVPDLNQV